MRLEFISFSLSMGGHCNEIVMVARSERIVSRQNGSNRPICNPLKRGVEQNIFQTVQTHVCIAKPLYRLGHDKRKNKAPLHEPPRSTHSLCAVQRETPNFLASILNGSFPCARCLLRSAASFRVNLRSGGRPKILPLARALPDLTSPVPRSAPFRTVQPPRSFGIAFLPPEGTCPLPQLQTQNRFRAQFEASDQIFQRTSESVKFPDNHDID
jgi:hypothetical protein